MTAPAPVPASRTRGDGPHASAPAKGLDFEGEPRALVPSSAHVGVGVPTSGLGPGTLRLMSRASRAGIADLRSTGVVGWARLGRLMPRNLCLLMSFCRL